jgi:hypothetical protein
MTVVVANLVVVTHRGVGWHSRAREHGNCNYSKQYVPEDSHDFAPFFGSGRISAAARSMDAA